MWIGLRRFLLGVTVMLVFAASKYGLSVSSEPALPGVLYQGTRPPSQEAFTPKPKPLEAPEIPDTPEIRVSSAAPEPEAQTLGPAQADKVRRVAALLQFGRLESGRRHDTGTVGYAREHFLVYRRGGGLNNRVTAVEICLLLAVLSNRTLLIETMQNGHMRGHDSPYTDFLEKIEGWPVLAAGTISEAQRRSLLRNSNKRILKLHPEVNCSVDLLAFVSELHRFSEVKVLEYAFEWGYWSQLFSEEYHSLIAAFVSTHVRFKHSLADPARASMPVPFGLIHFRLGDRDGRPLWNCSEIGYETGKKFSCVLRRQGSFEYLGTEQAVRLWHIPEDIKDIYIATNRPNHTRVAAVRHDLAQRGFQIWQWEDVARHWTLGREMRDGSKVSAAEQAMAIHAQAYLPSFPSTWTSVVIARRWALQKPEAEKQHRLMAHTLVRGRCHRPKLGWPG